MILEPVLRNYASCVLFVSMSKTEELTLIHTQLSDLDPCILEDLTCISLESVTLAYKIDTRVEFISVSNATYWKPLTVRL